MIRQSSLADRPLINRIDWSCKYGYLIISLADGVSTVLDRALVGTPEATPVYRELMATLGDAPGFAVSLLLEYLLIFGLRKVSPQPFKIVVLVIPAYIHCMGCLAHFDILTQKLPSGIDTYVWANVQYLNRFGQTLSDQASNIYGSLGNLFR